MKIKKIIIGLSIIGVLTLFNQTEKNEIADEMQPGPFSVKNTL